jgi:hypothetical protein
VPPFTLPVDGDTLVTSAYVWNMYIWSLLATRNKLESGIDLYKINIGKWLPAIRISLQTIFT